MAKIIAKVNDYEYIVKMSRDEINKLTGSYLSGYDSYKVETTINISKTFDYLAGIVANQEKITTHARNLRSMADMIESMPKPIEEPKEN